MLLPLRHSYYRLGNQEGSMDRKALVLMLVLLSFFLFFFLLKITTISQTSSQLRISLEPLQNWTTIQPIRGVKQAE